MTTGGRDPQPWLAVAVGLLAAAVYLGSLGNVFTFDDEGIIVDNPVVHGEAGLARIFTSHYWAGEARRSDLYRPLTIATYWINFRLSGKSPWSYHLVNLLLHGAVTSLAFLIFLRLSGLLRAAAAAAILFAVHSVHTEAVASIVGRAELLAALFVLAAWLLRDRPWVAAPLFFCGLLSKENAVVLPALLLVEDLAAWRAGKGRARSQANWYLQYVPCLIAIAAFLALRFAVLGGAIVPSGGPFVHTPALHRILTAVAVIGRYLWLMVWPVQLSADYSYAQIPLVTSPLDFGFLAGAGAMAGCAAIAWLGRRRAPAVVIGILIFFVALAPVSNLAFGIGVVMAERLLYLPSAGLCLVAGTGIEALAAAFSPRRAAVVAILAVLAPAGALTARTAARIRVWRDQRTLFEATVRSAPRSALAHSSLATIYQREGRLDEADAEYRRAIAIDPESAVAYAGLASLMEARGRVQDALAAYREAIRLEPERRGTHNDLGLLYQSEGRFEEAEAEFRRAITIDTDRAAPHSNLAILLESGGRLQEALAEHLQAARLDPTDVGVLNNLGRSLIATGNTQDAIAVLERAVSLSPGDPKPAVNLAAAWLAAGDLGRAEMIARGVLAGHPDEAAARRVLEAAQQRAGGAASPK